MFKIMSKGIEIYEEKTKISSLVEEHLKFTSVFTSQFDSLIHTSTLID